MHCRNCGCKESKRNKIDQFAALCGKCAATSTNNDTTQVVLNTIWDNVKLGDIEFKDFRVWIEVVIQHTVQRQIEATVASFGAENKKLKTDVDNATKKVTTLQSELNNLKVESSDQSTQDTCNSYRIKHETTRNDQETTRNDQETTRKQPETTRTTTTKG